MNYLKDKMFWVAVVAVNLAVGVVLWGLRSIAK